jgi:mono/diheme cytochrome c family protein
MRKFLLWIAALGVAGLAGAYVVTDPAFLRLVHGRSTAIAAAAPDLVNGKTMFDAGGCASCHAVPGQADRTKVSGGLALHSPFGTFHVPNITPHPRDGIGNWTPADFVRAMREGVSPDGRHYYPSFPYTSYQRMATKDLTDLFGYIKSLAAVEGQAKAHELPFPFNIRRLLGGWKLLNLDGKPFTPDPARDVAWNRGAYLVEGPGHCAECHSPRDALGGIVTAKRFAGGPDPEGKGTVPNITPHKDGISGWTSGEMASFLKTGDTPGFVNVGGSMGSVIKNTAQLSDADRAAMAAYLVSLKPVAGKPVAPAKK